MRISPLHPVFVGEVSGVDYLARRAAGFDMELMHAEVANGMDALAVWDAVRTGAALSFRKWRRKVRPSSFGSIRSRTTTS